MGGSLFTCRSRSTCGTSYRTLYQEERNNPKLTGQFAGRGDALQVLYWWAASREGGKTTALSERPPIDGRFPRTEQHSRTLDPVTKVELQRFQLRRARFQNRLFKSYKGFQFPDYSFVQQKLATSRCWCCWADSTIVADGAARPCLDTIRTFAQNRRNPDNCRCRILRSYDGLAG